MVEVASPGGTGGTYCVSAGGRTAGAWIGWPAR